MKQYSYRFIVKQPPHLCSALLLHAYENQHELGVEISPGWKHNSCLIIGKIKGTNMILHSSRLSTNAHGAILYADILDHEQGSEIVGVFRMNPSISFIVWFCRIFFTVFFFAPITILLLTKYRDWQSFPTFGLSLAILIMVSIYLLLMFGLNRLRVIPLEDVHFVHDFIVKATSSSTSKEAEQVLHDSAN
jgi:hypothetical protein